MKIILDPEKCRGCGLCMDVCKRGVMEFREDTNSCGCRTVAVVHPEKCVLCGLCVAVCPVHGITIKNDGKRGVRT
ncbi:4Fe-4S binding protein [Aminivibrio sp.]|jgi:2-oxoglutarate ferredoxin oxidoreductase subunit delta|uniref:4Fe-4S binding protein n=1 Tax=Aminivibrio sp. TaxID=1872489 RepID=UPI001DB6F377|nr:ferredoxin family protein [Synergistaceae bacterium]NCC56815.1 ferredoxin family protein [Synergistales bacterium]